jgi:hypothetical protein
MHVLAADAGAWWRHLDVLVLAERFEVAPPVVLKAEPWGLTLAHVSDPSGVLWHFAQLAAI